MTNKEKCRVQYKVDDEGLDYTFQHYSHYEDIQDPEFHRLRQAYLQAARELEEYIQPDYVEDDFDTDSDPGDEDDN